MKLCKLFSYFLLLKTRIFPLEIGVRCFRATVMLLTLALVITLAVCDKLKLTERAIVGGSLSSLVSYYVVLLF